MMTKTYFNEFVFFFVSVAVFLLSYFLSSVFFSVAAIWLIFLLSLFWFNGEKDFSDPRVFVTSFFALYHTWFPISFFIGKEHQFFDVNEIFLFESVSYSLFGIVCFVNICSFYILASKSSGNVSLKLKESDPTTTSGYLIFFISLSISIFAMVFFSNSGFESKSDINSQGGLVKQLSYFSMLLANVVILIRATRLTAYRIFRDRVVVFFLFVSICYVGFTGERDTIFRTLICLLLIFFGKQKSFGAYKIILFLFFVSFIVPVSQAFKAVFLSGFGGFTITLNSIFSNEFISASRNLYSLIHFGVDYNLSYLFTDFLRALIPSFLIGDGNIYSASQWFNSSFRVLNDFQGRAGWGFGIIAEGYLLGGYVGVFVVIFIMSSIISRLYLVRFKSEYYYVWYILSLTVVLYVMRADLANLLSQIFKVNGLAIILLFLTSRFFVGIRK